MSGTCRRVNLLTSERGSTDVLKRVQEVVAGKTVEAVLSEASN